MPNEHGETRRERNDRADVVTPEFCIPSGGETYWIWYHQISDSTARVMEGICYPIEPRVFVDWAQLTQTIVTADEYAILRAMDRAFTDEMNLELQAYQERLRNPTGREDDA